MPRRLALRSGLAMIALPPSEVTRDAIHLLRNRSRSALVAAFVAVLKDVAQAEGIPANSAASGDSAR
ncbi:hypothetical protein [Sphingopyxis sp. DBS4]|uniref:hypothetical protein n=1 Tax=Sphingopyxis sp. DBS4 TaxID=2968500 RepID=UPI00214BBA93|nr:hypothetical protein [Sphingopyxis sp. DBS4]